MSLAEKLLAILEQVAVLPRRISLRTPGVRATVPMLRGVWGAALHDLAIGAYREVFEGVGRPHERTPAFILRPAQLDPEDAPALEWISFGAGLQHDAALLRAWDIASGMGLGSERTRFHIRALRVLDRDGQAHAAAGAPVGWPLSEARWPVPGSPASAPCRLAFFAPLRLLRRRRLIAQPTLADLVVAASRRLRPFLAEPVRDQLATLRTALLETARRLPALPWRGQRLDLVRYSARQRSEIEMRGVTGCIDLPEGAGDIWPLFAAAQWLHLGKGAVVGLGQLVVAPFGEQSGGPE